MVATAKAKKESKEVYRRVVLIIVTKSSFERAPYSRSRMGRGGRFVSFTTYKFSRGGLTSSSQSNLVIGNNFLNKEGNLSEHNLSSSKTHFPEMVTLQHLRHVHALVLNFFSKRKMGKFPLAGRLQYF